MPRFLSACKSLSTGDGIRLAGRADIPRSAESQATPCRGRLSHGFDAGELLPIPPFFTVGGGGGELRRPSGSGSVCGPWSGQPFSPSGVRRSYRTAGDGGGAFGNAATRAEVFICSQGAYAQGGYPDIDALCQQQAVERNRTRREVLLHRIQQLTIERVMFARSWTFAPWWVWDHA